MHELAHDEKEQLRNILLKEGDHLQSQIISITDELSKMSEGSADPVDNASVIQDRNQLLIELSRASQRLELIKRTLSNWSDYGDCQSCGDMIPFKRLIAQPTSTECIHCKEISEKRGTLGSTASHSHYIREDASND